MVARTGPDISGPPQALKKSDSIYEHSRTRCHPDPTAFPRHDASFLPAQACPRHHNSERNPDSSCHKAFLRRVVEVQEGPTPTPINTDPPIISCPLPYPNTPFHHL